MGVVVVRTFPDPVWPVLVLAGIQLADALMCLRPLGFIAQCLRDVRFPRRYWWLLTPIKLASAVGLVLGIWVPYLGLLTCAALVVFFVVAIGMHLRARDFGRNLFVNATGMSMICCATTYIALVR